MGQIYAEEFSKGENTRIVSFVARDGSLELDEITVRNNMPEVRLGNAWLRNEKSHLVARAISGSGRIAVRQVVDGKTLQERMELGDPEHGAEVLPGQYYAWENDYNEPLVVAAAFSPAFDQEFYVERTEKEIQRREALEAVADVYLEADDLPALEALTDSHAILNYLYDRLLDVGQDPTDILKKFYVTEDKKGEDN